MRAFQAMRAKLLATVAVTTALGATDTVFVGHVPRGTPRKHVVIHGIGGDPGHVHLEGAAAAATPLAQVECWGATVEEAVAIADAVDAALNGVRGAWGSGSTRTWIQGCIRRDRRGPTPQDALDGSDAPAFSVQLDYLLGHNT